jgi:hypothetical protein
LTPSFFGRNPVGPNSRRRRFSLLTRDNREFFSIFQHETSEINHLRADFGARQGILAPCQAAWQGIGREGGGEEDTIDSTVCF